MRITLGPALVTAAFLGPIVAADASAQVTRIEFQVVESSAFGGESFGSIGQYERIRGVAYGEVDPNDVRHREIVNLDKAPLNARGRVEYSTMVEIHRPIDLERWNKAIYHIVPNRGRASAGDAVFREMGFAIVQVGWQGDLTVTDTNIVPVLPIAKYPNGSSVVGPAVEEFIFNDEEPVSEVDLTYATAAFVPAMATFTVRARQGAPPVTLEDPAWSYTNERQIRINRPSGFDGGAIYELIYLAKDPIVMGLGFAATRDVISFLRFSALRDNGRPRQPESPHVRRPAEHRHLPGTLPERPIPEGHALPGVQRGHRWSYRLRRHAPQYRWLAEDVYELSVQPTGAVAKAARGPLLPGESVPLYLCDRYLCDRV